MIYLASDHRGMVRKEEVKKILDEMGEKHTDMGNMAFDPEDDAIDYVVEACGKIKDGDKGIFFCGSGVMVDVAANRFSNIRSCLAVNVDQVKAARKEDNANVLCLGADSFGLVDSENLVRAFLGTEFSNEKKYKERIERTKNL